MLTLFTAVLLFANNLAVAQNTCATAVPVTATNASSCTPGTAFTVSAIGTGPAFASCATGVANPINAWGSFTACSSTATISYTPPSFRDAMIFVYSGSCPTPTQVDCVDAVGNAATETLSLSGLTAGTVYYFRVVAYNRNSGSMAGTICVASPYTIVTGTISGSPLCAGSTVSVPFTSYGTYSSNTYTAQLSDASGSFSSPTNIGTLTSNLNSGSISATIPAATATGTGYRIRVISSNPSVTGSDNGTNITVNAQPQGSLSGNTVCGIGTGELTFTATAGTGPFSVTYKEGLINYTKNNITSGTPFTPTLTPIVTTNYTLVSVTDNIGCTRTTGFTGSAATITFGTTPVIVSSLTAATRCYNATSQNSSITYSLTTGSPTLYSITWDATALAAGLVNVSNASITSSPLTVPVAAGVVAGTYNGTLTVTNASGCTSTGNSFTLTINAKPTISGTLGACTGSTTQLTGSGIPALSTPWASSATGIATVNSSGLVTGVTVGSSTITYTDINGCNNTASVIISVVPSATGATICVGGSGTISCTTTCSGGGLVSSGATNPATAVNNTGVGTGAWTNPGNITTTGSPYATQNLAPGATTNYLIASNYGFAIPTNATINGITVTVFRRGNSTSITDNIVSLVKGGSITGSNLASGTGWANGSMQLATYGGTNTLWGTTWTAADINASNFGVAFSAKSSSGSTRQLDIDYIQVNIRYTTSGTVNWYTASSGGSAIGSGSPFNPVGVAGSGLADSNTPGSTTFYAECAAAPGCRGAANFIILSNPTITLSSAASNVCYNSSSQNASITYSATTQSPTQYAITWDAAAQAAGLVNLANTAITTSPLNVPIAASVAAGTYTGSITVTNAGGCTSSGYSFTVTINPLPTITASATAYVKCFSTGTQNCALTYSATTNSPTTYSVTWDAAAQAAGLNNVNNATLFGSPLSAPMPASLAAGTYNAVLTVADANGCTSTGHSFTQQIVAIPTITASSTATSLCYSTSSQNSSLSYSGTTGSPTMYSITWDAAAQSAGLVNVGLTSLPASPITVPVAGGVAAGTYNGTLNVMNGAGCQSSPGSSFTLSISSASGPVMTSASTASVCSGGTVNIPLTSSIPATYTWIAASNTNVSGESLTTQTTSTLNNTLTITGSSTQTITYTVTPTAGCPGIPQTVTVTVNAIPSITASATAASRCYSTSAQTTTLSYSATTNSPVTYQITWNAAALAAGLANTGNVSLPASPITFTIPAGVAAATYTGSLTVSTAGGCTSTGSSFTVAVVAIPAISSQPSSTTACTGSSASFSVSATGTSLTYQWRKGTTNICNCGGVSGATTATLNISSVTAGDAATNYNCVVSSITGCSTVISNYATLTVNTAASAPTTLPKDLVFPTVATTSILSSFTAASDATHYLVIRKTTNVAPTNPSNGTTYTLNSTTLTGSVDYVGTSTSFTSNGLTPGTTYYYWVFPYNISSCGTSPLYLTTTPLTGEATTATNVACGTVTTLYWGGTGSNLPGRVTGTDFNTAANWSTSSSTYVASPAAPSECNNVSLALTSAATITLSSNADVYGLNFTLSVSAGASATSARLSTQGNTLNVNSNAVVDVLTGNSNTNIYIGENSAGAGTIDFKANFRIGETYFSSGNVPKSYMIGNVNSKIIFRGDVLFGRSAAFILPGQTSANVGYPPSYPIAAPGTGTTPGTILFDGMGLQQVLWNNNVWYDCFYNIVVGEQNKPYVKHVTGTYTPDNILNDFTINSGSTVDLGSSQWIREQSGGTLSLNGTAKLILGNNLSVRSSSNTGIRVTGSNFPGGFSTMSISSSSTIEYNGGNSITQTVYSTPTYGNLILSNIDGTGTANKISTGIVSVDADMTVNDKTTFTPGTTVYINNSNATVNSGGTWVCGTNIVTGGGSFNLASGGNLTMASTAGITASGATGNIQTDSRDFSTGGNYTYNASSAQAAGSGLPTTVNNLTISNSSGVTMYAASADYTVAGTLNLASGPLVINGNTLIINNLQRTSGTLTGSSTSSVGITGTNIPLFFTSGGRTLKNLSLYTNASADLQTTLDITAGSNAGSIAVGSGATLNTYGYITLKSDANGTARVAEIPVDGSGNALGNINGNVTIERYIPGRRSWRMVTAPVQASGSQTINQAWQEGAVNTDLTNNQNPNPGFGIHISGSSSSLGFDVTPLNNPSLKVFTRSNSSWNGIPNTLSTYVRDYEGYMLFVRGNRSTNLSQNTSATLTNTVIRETGGVRMGRQPVSLPGGTGSYSVVGNPYPSTIDFRTLSITGGGNTKSFVMWDPALTGTTGVGAYQYFTRVGGAGSDYAVFPGGGSYGVSGTINNYVQSGQAFLIPNTSAATLYIEESSKAAPSTSSVFRPMPDNITGRISTILYGFENDNTPTVLDGGLVLYRSEFDDVVDMDDVIKINNTNSENFGLNKSGSVYEIEKRQTISETDTIYYSMRNLKARAYQLVVELKNMEATGMTAYLKDNYTGTVTTLDYSTPYTLNFTPTNAAPGSYAPDRFKIYFKELHVLPVTFTSLEAYRKENAINVSWKVQNETNIHHYEVERSADGINFTKLGVSITATNSSAYQVADENPLPGINYFRVKAIENNRRGIFTSIARVFFGKNASGITVFPNPVTDGKINVYITGEQKGDYHANLYNTSGQLMQTLKLAQINGDGNAVIEMKKDLPHGNYILEMIKPDLSKEHINIIY